jgi:tetratricopeptide (TPR) repeat protein
VARDLANNDAMWVTEVVDAWPGPIAHEYWRLRALLAAGHIVPALLEFKDLVEVLLKFPALVMARDLIVHGDAPAADLARRALLHSGKLSLGQWLRPIVTGELAPAVLKKNREQPMLSAGIAQMFVSLGDGQRCSPTQWSRQLEEWIQWRNEQIGHGAFRLDVDEYLPDLATHIGLLADHLRNQRDTWLSLTLRITADGTILKGWQSIRRYHDAAGHSAGHAEESAEIELLVGDASLALWPYVRLQHCPVCSKRDVFLFDSSDNARLPPSFRLLDYLGGHGHIIRTDRDELTREFQKVPTLRIGRAVNAAMTGDRLDGAILDGATVALLRERSLESQYLPPNYLLEPLKRFLSEQRSGVFWLEAPGHIGKTTFVAALSRSSEKRSRSIPDDMIAFAFHIKREFQSWATQLQGQLSTELVRHRLGLIEGREPLPNLELESAQPEAALGHFLRRLQQLRPEMARKMLICIDGLDELQAQNTGERSIADLLPDPQSLPQGCYVVITSRLLADCPEPVRRILSLRYPPGPQVTHLTFTLDGPRAFDTAPPGTVLRGYRDLLESYFWMRMQPRLMEVCGEALLRFRESLDPARPRYSVSWPSVRSICPSQGLARGLEQLWKNDIERHAEFSARGPSLVDAIETVLEPYRKLCRDLFEKAGGRFLFIAHISDLISERDLDLPRIGRLPTVDDLCRAFLSRLEHDLSAPEGGPDKAWDLARRMLLHLAAAEEAHDYIERLLPASVRRKTFEGVPLDVLADLVGTDSQSLRFVFTLYSLKPALRVSRRQTALGSRLALGLTGLTRNISEKWPTEFTATHSRLVEWAAAALTNEQTGERESASVWAASQIGGSIAASGGNLDQRKRSEVARRCLKAIRGQGAASKTDIAIRILTGALDYASAVENREDQGVDHALVGRLRHARGIVLASAGDLHSALVDEEEALHFAEELVATLGTRCTTDYRLGPILVLASRAQLRGERGDWSGAHDDLGRALELLSDLIQREDNDRIVECRRHEIGIRNSLALVRRHDDLEHAVAESSTAIELCLELMQEAGGSGATQWGDLLPGLYLNRGTSWAMLGDQSLAQSDFNRAVDIAENVRIDQMEPIDATVPPVPAIARFARGNFLAKTDRIPEAIDDLDEALRSIERAAFDPDGSCSIPVLNLVCQIHMQRGFLYARLDPASDACTDELLRVAELLSGRVGDLGDECPPALLQMLADCHHNLGWILEKRRETAIALIQYDHAVQLRTQATKDIDVLNFGLLAVKVAGSLAGRARALQDEGRLLEAMGDFTAAETILRREIDDFGERCPVQAREELGRVYEDMGRIYQALDQFENARSAFSKASRFATD